MRHNLLLILLMSNWLNVSFANTKERFVLNSPDLPEGKPIGNLFVGRDFGCTGPNLSPELIWQGEPKGTKSFAITMFDTYTPPASGWWHWFVFNLPANTHSLPRNAGTLDGSKLPTVARQGRPDGEAPEPRYYGPCPDIGDKPHHYIITVYALSVDHVDIPVTATGAQMDYVLAGKALAKTSIDRVYSR